MWIISWSNNSILITSYLPSLLTRIVQKIEHTGSYGDQLVLQSLNTILFYRKSKTDDQTMNWADQFNLLSVNSTLMSRALMQLKADNIAFPWVCDVTRWSDTFFRLIFLSAHFHFLFSVHHFLLCAIVNELPKQYIHAVRCDGVSMSQCLDNHSLSVPFTHLSTKP